MLAMQQVLLHLSLIDGVGPAVMYRLASQSADLQELYACSAYDMQALYGCSAVIAEKVVQGLRDKVVLERELALIQKHEVRLHTILDDSYPLLLRHIHCPPAILYEKGAPLAKEGKAIAIVGARKADAYAQHVVRAIVPSLVNNGWQIVSGGAVGADTMAHTQALRAGGTTVAVLGSSLLAPYPHCNRRLFNEMVASGSTVVSPFGLQSQVHPGNFPARNRVIAGLSQACVVVQAAQKSGAKITASFALEQGRHVFAVPGDIFNPLSDGCHMLIKDGATPIRSANDLLSELGETMQKEQKETQLAIADTKAKTPQEQLLQLLAIEPLSVDDCMQKTGLSLPVLQEMLFNLQLEGNIEQTGAGMWHIC